MKKRDFLTGPLRWLFFAVVLIAFVAILYGADQGRRHMSNRAVDWLPSGFNETKDFNWFLKHFYEGELLMASWDGCKPDDPRLDEIAKRLTTPNESGKEPFYWKVMTTSSVFQDLTGNPLNLTPEEARERMRGWIISKDDTQGCLIAFLSEEGYNDQKAAIDLFKTVTADVAQLSSGRVHIAGPSIDSVAIDEASNNSQKRLLPLFLLVCVLMLFLLLRVWLAVFAIFVTAIFNEEMSAALIYYSGTNMDSISLLSASLLFILSISGGLHLLNYYREAMERNGKQGAVVIAIKKAILPCSLACLTTVLGLYSLSISQVVPIRHFGIFSSIALFLGTCFFIVYIGAFMEQFPILAWLTPSRRSRSRMSYDDDEDDEIYEDYFDRTHPYQRFFRSFFSMKHLWIWLPTFVIRHYIILTIFNIAALVVLGAFLPKLETTVTFHGMFPEKAPVIQDYNYLENKVGGLIPVEVVINVPEAQNPDATPLQMLSLLDKIEQTLRQVEGVESSLSALTFVPYLPDPEATGFRAASTRSVFNRMVNQRLTLLKDGCLFDDRSIPEDEELQFPQAQRWRISLRVCAKSKIAYGPFLQNISEKVDEAIAQNQQEYELSEVTSLITGGVPLVHKTQSQLLEDLSNSYLSAFGMILLTLIFLLRGIGRGFLAMIPNIFPSVIVFGLMAMLRQPVDMGTMMTASVALGISVDATIHFMTWYNGALSRGKTRRDAIHVAYRECGTALVQAALICGGGMLVFALSGFIPISRFAWMIALLLMIALYGSLVLFPALLAGPLGYLFFSSRYYRKRLSDKKANNKTASSKQSPSLNNRDQDREKWGNGSNAEKSGEQKQFAEKQYRQG